MNQTTLLHPIRRSVKDRIELLDELRYNIEQVEQRISENSRKIHRMNLAGSEVWDIYPFSSIYEQEMEKSYNIQLLARLQVRFNKVLESLKY